MACGALAEAQDDKEEQEVDWGLGQRVEVARPVVCVQGQSGKGFEELVEVAHPGVLVQVQVAAVQQVEREQHGSDEHGEGVRWLRVQSTLRATIDESALQRPVGESRLATTSRTRRGGRPPAAWHRGGAERSEAR